MTAPPPAIEPRIDFNRALKHAAIAGIVTFGMLLPLIGFRTIQDMRNELVLETRPLMLAIFVLIAIAGSLLISLVIVPWRQRRAAAHVPGESVRRAQWRAHVAKWFVPFALGFVILYPVIVLFMSGLGGALKWIDNFGIQILIYVMLGWGLNIVVGLAGLLDLGYVAFYAVGAYSYALLAKELGLSFWILLPLAGILSAFWGILLGFPVLRLRGDYLAIVTLAFGEIIRLVLINWVDFTNGYAGISGIPRPTFFGIPFNANDDGFAAVFGLEFTPVYRTIFLYYVILGPRPAHRLRHHPAAAAAGRPRLGGLARGRDRLPFARPQHHQHQAHGVCDGGDVRRHRRLVLRRAAGIHLAGILHLYRIGDHPCHCGARRNGQHDRRRHRRHRHDWRQRDPA